MRIERKVEIEQKRTVRRLSAMAALVAMAVFFGVSGNAVSATVNWLDPLNYQKPQPVDIPMPNEATVTNKYYVDMSAGSGSACSQTSPCANLDNVIGKPGTTGGPAYVYVRGTGSLSLFNDTFYGSPGNEIVIKPWGTATATFAGNSNTNSGNVHHILFDGGPNLGLVFLGNVNGQYSLHIMSNNTTIYRTRSYCTASAGTLMSMGDSSVNSNVSFINNEFYGCGSTTDQSSAIYAGPGGGGGYNNLIIKNNIIRQMGGEGIEINPRVTSSGLEISGNAIHDIGKVTCNLGWKCRPAIVLNSQNGQSNPNVVIKNNLMWDTASGCIWMRSPGSNQVIYNNTCYDFGKISPNSDESPNPQGISGGNAASIRNNIIYAPNGTNPFDSSYSASNNLCGSGESCGSSSKTWSANLVLSTDQNASDFMRIGSGSEARNSGYSISGVTIDYAGKSRPQETSYDIGADEYGATSVSLQSPSNLRVVVP